MSQLSTNCPWFPPVSAVFTRFFICFVLFTSSDTPIIGQVDTSYFNDLMDTIYHYQDQRDDDMTMHLIDSFIEASKNANYRRGIKEGLMEKGWYYVEMNQFEPADSFYQMTIQEAEADNDHLILGQVHHRKAFLSKATGNAFQAVEDYENSIKHFKAIEDDYRLCSEYVIYAHHLSNIDDYEAALENYDLAYQACQREGDEEYSNYTLQGIGIVYARMNEFTLADSFYMRVLNKYDESEHYRFKAILNNRAILMKNQEKYKEALDIYNSLINDSENKTGHGVSGALMNRAEVYFHLGKYELAYQDALTSCENMVNLNHWLAATNGYSVLGNVLVKMGKPRQALDALNKGLEYAEMASSVDKYMDNYEVQVSAYEALGDNKNALYAHKQYTLMKDSLFNIEKADKQRLAERKLTKTLEEAENALLKSELSLNQIKRTRLWISIAAISIIGIGGMLFLNYRSRKDKRIYKTDKELQNQKLKNEQLEKERIKRDLEIKKQELLASALQIQNKNEVLANLNTQISELKSADLEKNSGLSKISRQIDLDLESNSEWDRFIQSFSEVHIDFVNRLNRNHPDLSRHQVRLLCLMKMNLSSREIGNILNISAEGVKKARYRVKKKLGLSTDDKIEDFLNDTITLNLEQPV